MKKIEEKKESFFAKHFKKKRAVCSKCKNDIDSYLSECPYCGSERNVDVLPKKFLNMTLLSDYKELCFFLIGTLGLVIIYFLIETGVNNFPIKVVLLPKAISYLLTYCVVVALFFCVVSHDTRKVINSIKKQNTKPLTWIAVGIGLALIIAFSYGYTAILNHFGITIKDSANQQQITNLIKNQPAISFFFIVLLAPIIEEFTYRVGLFSFFRKRNRWLAYIIAVILFSFMHFIPSFFEAPQLMANEALNIPLYIVPSLILAISYEYAGLSSSTYIHILNNLISFILVLTL